MKIGTHDGVFHADEVTACAILRFIFGEIQIIRTRDAEILATCDILVDVGLVYDPENNKFDHHQDCSCRFNSRYKRMSSAGMVYKAYGKRFITQFINKSYPNSKLDGHYNAIFEIFYDKFIYEVDLFDQGLLGMGKVGTSVSTIVSRMNIGDAQDENFICAMDYCFSCMSVILKHIIFCRIHYDSDAKIIEMALSNRTNEPYVIISKQCVDWKYHTRYFLEIGIHWIIHRVGDNPEQDSCHWRLFCVRQNAKKFSIAAREALGKNLIFMHKKRFIAETASFQSAIHLINMSK